MSRGALVSFLLSALFVYLFLFQPHPAGVLTGESGLIDAFFQSRVDWPGVLDILSSLRLLPFLGALGALILSLVIRAWRWRVIVVPVERLPVPLFFHLTNLGYMASNLLPMRLGELLRAMALKARSRVGLSAAFASIILERLLDMAGAAGVLFLLLLIGPPLPVDGESGIMMLRFQQLLPWLGMLVGALTLLLLCLVLFRERLLLGLERLLGRVLPAGPASRLHNIAETFSRGLSILRSPGEALGLLLLTALIYCCYLGSLAFMLQAFGFDGTTLPLLGERPFAAICMLLVFVSLGYMIPAAPGAIGTVQYFTLLALQLLGDAGPRAQSFALGNHLLTWLVLTLLGLAALPALKLDFRKLMEWKKERH